MNNERAFPRTQFDSTGQLSGMKLRDYFAAAAMQGIVAGCGNALGQVNYDDTTLTRNAYILADKMLEAREVTGE